jgi:hypothetical protein
MIHCLGFHRWPANLRIIEVDEIKATPGTPRSNAFVERLIGTVWREYLDRTLFWDGQSGAEARELQGLLQPTPVSDRVDRSYAG